jgi:starch synthase
VKDFGEEGGYGICFDQASVGDMTQSIFRAVELYKQPAKFDELRNFVMQIDNSWENIAGTYISLYES